MMLSIIIPAYNEAGSIEATINELLSVMDETAIEYEVIVVNDGSSDNTLDILKNLNVRVHSHPTNGGYGRAIKSGLALSRYDWCCICDADNTYPVTDIPKLLEYIPAFDMVVGARTGKHYWGSLSKRMGRLILLSLVAFVIGYRIPDINSGLRIFRKEIAVKHIRRISSGFSFTTTLTLAMALDEHFLKYVPINYRPRLGAPSKVRIRIDSLRMLQILTMATLFYNPLKLFLPVCLASVFVGFVTMVISLLSGSSDGWLIFPLSILISFVIGALGFIAEAVRLQSTIRENSLKVDDDIQLQPVTDVTPTDKA